VTILVEFYDTVGGKEVKLTDADVNYEWLTPNHDWTDSNAEFRRVTYMRPKAKSPVEEDHRKYLGYRIRVYYDDKLEAVQAEPSRLLQLFPPSGSGVDSEQKSSSPPTSTSNATAANVASNNDIGNRSKANVEATPTPEPSADNEESNEWYADSPDGVLHAVPRIIPDKESIQMHNLDGVAVAVFQDQYKPVARHDFAPAAAPG